MTTDETMTCAESRNFFVDEAGDLSLFNKRGQSLIGRDGVSSYFMLGFALVPDPALAHEKIEELRGRLLADPYFKGIPSMQPSAGKTARAFHAKDDIPEVRREVFRRLATFNCQVQVVVRRKVVLLQEARTLFAYRGEKLRSNDIYDSLVSRLFKNVLHKADENHIVFARRGKGGRRVALEAAIIRAKERFAEKWGVLHDKPTTIAAGHPWDYSGLQIVDYYMWALQRMYERGEDRFFDAMRADYSLIMDIDDTRNRPYGEWYTARNPLQVYRIEQPPES